MSNKPIIKEGYISPLDKFLREFDRTHPSLCPSRLAEVKKHAAIAEKRDNVVDTPSSGLWEKF